ncbi:hypothetical protein GCM10023096_27290 [Nonomuraea ferruginea]
MFTAILWIAARPRGSCGDLGGLADPGGALLAGLLGEGLQVRGGLERLLLRLKDSHATIFQRYRVKDKRDFLRLTL